MAEIIKAIGGLGDATEDDVLVGKTFSSESGIRKTGKMYLDNLDNNIDNTTTFNADGSITKEYVDGRSATTVFNADGSITTTTYLNGEISKVENTVFNDDGTITTTYTEGSGA